MTTLTTVQALRRYRRELTGRVALVPTMGALHEGHLSHVALARQAADHVVASIFVNPTQFGPNEDFDRYPRTLEGDLAQCEAAGVDAVFAPGTDQIYPPDEMAVTMDVPELTNILEGEARPGHFAGVCRVVAKLLNLVEPDVATFGRKDYQQLCVVRAMIRDLAMDVEVIEADTVRDADGLALSSRNRYLDAEQRRHALGLYKSLKQARMLVEQEHESDPAAVERAMAEVLRVHQLDVEYAVVRHPATLTLLDCVEPELTGGVVALAAVRLGAVRLIDNMVLGREA